MWCKIRFIATLAILLTVTACTSVTVKPVDLQENKINRVCIKQNPKVIVPEFEDILEEGFARHGIKAKVYENIPPDCKYTVTYTANQAWDVVTFLNSAHIALYKGDELIGYADRNSPKGVFGGGGIEPSKWDSTRTKVDPMIDQLLGGIAPAPQPSSDN